MTAGTRQIDEDSSARELTIDDALNYKDCGDQRVLSKGTSCVYRQVDGCLSFQGGAEGHKEDAGLD